MLTLRELREKKLFLSRRELAKLAHISPSTLFRMEEGEHTKQEMAEKVLSAISQKLGYEVSVNNVKGLKIYNVIRDRRAGSGRPKKKVENASWAGSVPQSNL